MPSRRRAAAVLSDRPLASSAADDILDGRQSSMLDVVDELLNKGVIANGEVRLGVAGVDLIYLRLSTLLCAADRVLTPDSKRRTKRRSRRHGRASRSRT